jgi:fructosamine-3-kinase
LFKQAYDQGLADDTTLKKFELFCEKLEAWIPAEKPALLHGDLWSGNFMTGPNGPTLIDPAVYYGHREMDIAMMHLFGGFDPDLFEAYHQLSPLERNWQERLDIHNLYPLLVHVLLFGESYMAPIKNTLQRFVG